MADVVDFIKSVGFPIAVAIWLLWQGERQHNQNIETLQAMRTELSELRSALAGLAGLVRDEINRGEGKHS